MGVRADITPQAARIDAHLLNHQGVTRLCYCGSVLHTLPATISAGREPVQIGAELYGFAGIEADLDVIRLMAGAFERVKLPVSRIDLGHVGIFQALAEAAGLPQEAEDALLSLLQAKDVPGLEEACVNVPSPYREALQRLPQLYGGAEVLDRAEAELPALPAITAALSGLRHLLDGAPDLPFSIDLSDLRGYHYHNGVVFAAYCPGYPVAIAMDVPARRPGFQWICVKWRVWHQRESQMVRSWPPMPDTMRVWLPILLRYANKAKLLSSYYPAKQPVKVRSVTEKWRWWANTGLLKRYKRIKKWQRMSSWWVRSGATKERAKSSTG